MGRYGPDQDSFSDSHAGRYQLLNLKKGKELKTVKSEIAITSVSDGKIKKFELEYA
jgi:hypothetical protein